MVKITSLYSHFNCSSDVKNRDTIHDYWLEALTYPLLLSLLRTGDRP